MWYSVRYRNGAFPKPLSLDSKIAIYEDRVWGWFLEIGRSLSDNVAADFVILMIILSFLEGHAMYLKGRRSRLGETKQFFTFGFTEVMKKLNIKFEGEGEIDNDQMDNLIDSAAKTLYLQARNGMFHDGMTRLGIILHRDVPGPFTLRHDVNKDIADMVINAPNLLEGVIIYFQLYTANLRDPANEELRRNFESAWDEMHQ